MTVDTSVLVSVVLTADNAQRTILIISRSHHRPDRATWVRHPYARRQPVAERA